MEDRIDRIQGQGEQRMLPALPGHVTLPQVLLTAGTLAASGIVDVAARDGTAAFVGLLVVFVVARHSNNIIDYGNTVLGAVVPGRDAARVQEITARVVDAAMPAREEYDDQAPVQKIKRLLGFKVQPPAFLQAGRGESQEEEPEDKEDEQPQRPTPYNKDLHRGRLFLGHYLYPEAREVLSKRIGMFGIPGSGKSNGVAVFVEELGRLPIFVEELQRWVEIGVPFVLADTEGEYFALCSRRYLMRPFYASAENVTPESAHQFGQDVLEKGLQVILDLQSYESDDEAAEIMIGIIAGMRAWAEARENDERATCMFILDEAAIWLPQQVNESNLSKEKDESGQALLARLQQAFFGTVVRRGRKRGIGFLFATQRPADLDKRCISCDWLMLFRQSFPNDLNKYAELGVPKDAAQALSNGEAFVIDPRGQRSVQQFRKRHSPDNSASPGPASLQKHAARWAEAAGTNEPASQQRRRLPEPEPAAEPVSRMEDLPPANQNQRRLTPFHRKALEHYQPGLGLRKLGELIGVGKDKAGDLKRDLIKWGFIEDDEAAE